MKKIRQNLMKIVTCAFIATALVSCNERGYDDYEEGATPAQALSGEWFVDVIDEASGTVYVQHALHKTYDNNEGKLIISDRTGPGPNDYSGWYLVSPVDYNLSNLTFSATGAENTSDGSIVNITEGKILKNAATSRDGNVVDSIYFKGEFDYDPGTIIIFSGHRRTGFHEDEY